MSLDEFSKLADGFIKKKSVKKEKSYEDKFVSYVKLFQCIAYKLIILNKRGFPDRTVLCQGGRIFFIEFKRPNKKRSPNQDRVRNLLIKLGFTYYTVHSLEEAKEKFHEFMESS